MEACCQRPGAPVNRRVGRRSAVRSTVCTSFTRPPDVSGRESPALYGAREDRHGVQPRGARAIRCVGLVAESWIGAYLNWRSTASHPSPPLGR